MDAATIPAYYNSVNEDLLSLLEIGARRVLEVGCGAGALARRYRALNPACRYVGVEAASAPAQAARGVVDLLIEGDVEAIPSRSLGEAGEFDLIIYGDVLEHLQDPWELVRRHRELLTPGGVMAACIPNVQYWRVLRDLLAGRWVYQDAGVLDRTHLRFFTAESAVALFANAGMRVEKVIGRRRVDAEFEAFKQVLTAAGATGAATSEFIQIMVISRNP